MTEVVPTDNGHWVSEESQANGAGACFLQVFQGYGEVHWPVSKAGREGPLAGPVS